MSASYPKVYKPNKHHKIFSGVLCLIASGALIQYLIATPYQYFSLESTVVYISVLASFYLVTIYSFGYSVTLYENAIEVKTFLTKNKVNTADITSYSSYFGKFGRGLMFVARAPHENSQKDFKSLDKKQINLTVHFSFDWDDDFVEWLAKLPCELNPNKSEYEKLEL